MFKKDITPGAKAKVKSSTQRALRNKLTDNFPKLAPYIDEIMPKKEQLDVIKLPDRVALYSLGGTPLFVQHMDDPIIPHLTLVHKFPQAFPRLRIDKGAIRFVLSGATLMVPGLTSKGGRLPSEEADLADEAYGAEDMNAGQVVVIDAEGKENACLVGILKMGTKEMKDIKKGVAMDGGHYIGDGLWRLVL